MKHPVAGSQRFQNIGPPGTQIKKIGVDGSCWINKRGYGRYTREIFFALFKRNSRHQYRFFMDAATARSATDLPDHVEVVVVNTREAAVQAAGASGSRSLSDIWAMSRAVQAQGNDLDVFYFPSVYSFFPVRLPGKVIVTIHDTIAERFPRLIFPNRKAEFFWRLKVQWAIRNAGLITTVSESAKRAIMQQFRLPDSAIQIVSDAVGPEFHPIVDGDTVNKVMADYGLTDAPFILYVGGISPHKNLATLIDAFSLLVEDGSAGNTRLVFVGDFKGDVFFSSYASLQTKMESLTLGGRIIFTGYVPDEQIVHFYNAATVLALPSFDEGFGLPAVEAMACGTPVAASNAGSLPEVVGEAGLYFNPNSALEMSQCLHRLLSDQALRERLGAAGKRRAGEYTWDRAAREALSAFESVIAK